jgi:hypothetical protein
MAPVGIADAVILATGLALSRSTGLGIAVGIGRLQLGRYRWLHHALYGAAVVSCLLTVAVGVVTATPIRWAMVVVLVPLAALTRTRGGTLRHVAVAGFALVLYVAVLVTFGVL